MKTSLIFQTDFSTFSSEVLKRKLKLSDNDKILMTVWMGHIHNLSVRDRYFCFTKEGLYWNFPAIVKTGSEGENAERLICESDFFQKEGNGFSLAFTKCDGDLNELHVKMGDRTFIFQFTKSFPKENLEELESIIRDYFTGYFDENKYEEKAKKDRLRNALYAIPDFFKQTGFVIADGYLKFLDKTECFFENLGKKKSNNESECSEKSEKVSQNQSVKPVIEAHNENRFLRFIRHTFDLIADLIFVSALIVLLKPELFVENAFFKTINIGEIKIKIFMDLLPNIDEGVLLKRNLIITSLFIIFTLLKIIIILSKRKNQKIVNFLLLVILGISVFIIQYSFIIFLLVSMLLLLTFQFTMCYSGQAIRKKIWIFIVLSIVLYISLHLILKNGLIEQITSLLSEFKLSVKLL